MYDYTKLSFIERLYFNISPTTIVIRRLFNILDTYKNKQTSKRKLKILDIGCGGGIKDLTLRGDVVGIDISQLSVRNARKIYKKVIVGDLSKKYPFPNESFDIAFCSEVYGHIEDRDKEHFLLEVKRVLKKDGLFLFSCETKGDNWLTRSLKKRKVYQKLWVDYDGHIGLESPNKVIERFKKHFLDVNYKVNNTYIFTVDELLPIYPLLNGVFKNITMRRFANILLFPVYILSVTFTKLSAANNICIYGKK